VGRLDVKCLKGWAVNLLIGLALLLLLVGIAAVVLSRRARRAIGLPAGRIVYADTSPGSVLHAHYFRASINSPAKPDYLVRDGRAIIPAEIKASRAPADGPRTGHTLQLAAYCLLVEETERTRPPYASSSMPMRRSEWTIPGASPSAGRDAEQHAARFGARQAHRSHADPARCRRCGFRAACDERLA